MGIRDFRRKHTFKNLLKMSPWRKMHYLSELLGEMLDVGRHVGKEQCHITSLVGLQDKLTQVSQQFSWAHSSNSSFSI